MDTEKLERRKPDGKKLLIRGTAAVLAVIMFLSTVLYSVSRVTINTEQYAEKDYRLSSRELMKENAYADSSRFSQMTAYAWDLLSGRHSFEDIELGAEIAVAQGRYADAIELTKQSIALYTDEDETKGKLYLRLGYLYILENDPEDALGWLDRGIALAPTPEAYLTRAQVQLDLGNDTAALRDTGTYTTLAENPGELSADMVNIYEATGEYETAANMYTSLIEQTGNSEYLLNRAYCYTNLGRMEDAEEDRNRYAAAGGTETGNADVMLGLGWMHAKEYVQARSCFIRAIDKNYPEPESLYFYVVLCSYMTMDFEQVCTYGDRLIDLVQNSGKDTSAEISVEKRTGRLNVTLVKMDLTNLYQMNGASHLATGNYETAESRLTDCLAADPENAYASYLRGVSRMALMRYREAQTDLDTAVAAGVETEKSRFSRAVCRMQTGDREGAIEDFEWVAQNSRDKDLSEDAARQVQQLRDESGGTEKTDTAE